MTEKTRPDLDPGLLATAEQRFRQRFRRLDENDPVCDALLRLGLERLPWDVDMFPDAYLATRHPPPGHREKVPSMEELAGSATIPAMPQVLFELQRVMNDPDSSASDLARVISNDLKLTASILRIANSPLYSFPSRVETVDRAVAILGFRQISTLASGAVLLNTFTMSNQALNLERFWRHSMACGVLARGLAVRMGLEEPEKFFVSGLLHDLGLLAMSAAFPDTAMHVRVLCREQGRLLTDVEQRVIGYDHARFGAYLLKRWNLPLLLVAGVAFHHTPARGAKWNEPKVLHGANFLANGLGLSINVDIPVEPLDPSTRDYLGLHPAKLEEVVRENEQRIEEAFSAFGLGE